MHSTAPVRRRPKAPISRFTKAPTNYVGNKIRLLHTIIPEFGDLTGSTFVDVFGGGMNVGMNVDAAHVWFNDASAEAAGLARYFSSSHPGQIEAEIEALIEGYGFSDSRTHGYEAFGGTSSSGLVSHNRGPYERLRDDYNSGVFAGRRRDAATFALVLFGFNNQIRLRARDGHWRNPAGKRDFNANVRKNLADTVARLATIDHSITNIDFREMQLPDGDVFCYADPPYLLGAAPYNKASWNASIDDELLDWLDGLADRGIPFAMSNVLTHKGQDHTRMLAWLAARDYRVLDLDFDYKNASHRITTPSKSREVLITSGLQLAAAELDRVAA
ncbi:DNA adenine methylase [Leucobacter sp. cx-169]|uniref:DNA adenine methylase n=1 Tax=Leucobacter sp. cx-169 TaxID=2770549 RepID=UPI00165DB714|nr:DNA adenine methylase [Leucobacter sp. cx-169]MBC9927342.1 DNA adenine methylase [Leucobacter sp. cx-169]